MDIYSVVRRPEKVFETVDKERITEQAGYVPAADQIQRFINAGRRLIDYRREAYDFVDEKVDMDMIDPTRRLDFDMAEGSELLMYAEERLEAAEKEIKAKKKLDKLKNEDKDKVSNEEDDTASSNSESSKSPS